MYRAIKSFSGLIRMTTGEVRDISDPSIVEDLLKAGYIEEFPPKVEEETKKSKAKKTKKKGAKKNED